MASIVFNKFRVEIQDKKDNRDPQIIGEKILNRPKHLSALYVADQLSSTDIPDYRDK